MQLLTTIFVAGAICLAVHGLPQNGGTQASNEDIDKIVADGVRSFGLNVVNNLLTTSQPEKNLLVSPLNIWVALALTLLGANGTTKNELKGTMGLPKDDQRLDAIHKSLSLSSKNMQYKSNNSYDVITDITMANGIFVQNNYKIKEAYLHLLKTYYDGNVANLDFATHPKEATDTINRWVSETTKGRIPEVFSSPLDPSTLAVLVSSLYFSAKWKDEFYKASTKVEKFNTGVKDMQVHMMKQTKYLPYLNDKQMQFEAIRIPYWGGDYSMIVILPYTTQSLSNLVKVLNSKRLGEIINNTDTVKVEYKIPRTKFSWRQSLVAPLSALGLKSFFSKPDFSNMVSSSVKVGDVVHATEIDIDEEGTKASAITAVQLIPLSGHFETHPKPPVPFHVNRPFMASIVYHPKDLLLFSALVQVPTDATQSPSESAKPAATK